MKRVLLNVLAGAALAAAPALAQFEGEVDMKITGQGMAGTGKAFVSKLGSRTEIDMQTAQMPVHMVSLMKFATPDVVYLINDKAKTYTEMDLKKARESSSKMTADKEPYTVKVLGSEKMLGYSTKHVLLFRPGDRSEMELWTTKDILGLNYEAVRGLMRRGSSQEDGSFLKALKDAGADGFFVKMITREKGKPEALTTMELTKAEKKSLPGSLFDIPPGYTK
jgi:Domain of unknown function (DUF4412)